MPGQALDVGQRRAQILQENPYAERCLNSSRLEGSSVWGHQRQTYGSDAVYDDLIGAFDASSVGWSADQVWSVTTCSAAEPAGPAIRWRHQHRRRQHPARLRRPQVAAAHTRPQQGVQTTPYPYPRVHPHLGIACHPPAAGLV